MQISSSFVSCVNHNKCEHRCVSGVSWYGMVSKDRITDEGANIFAKITEEHIGDQVEIYINENRIAAPYVHAAITGGVCQIPMSSNDEAEKIAEKFHNTR